MKGQDDPLKRLRVASPCRVGWGSMSGGERVRFCRECGLHVYNFSEMTADEVRALVARTEGRVCGRLYQRADGTVITRDCPVGLRAVRRRVARAAGASLAAVVGLFSAVAGQTRQRDQSKQDEKVCKIVRGLAVERRPSQGGAGSLAVEVVDPNGGLVVGADVTLVNEKTGEKSSLAMAAGEAVIKFAVAAEGVYAVEASAPYFKTVRARHVRLSPREAARVRIEMPVATEYVTIGVVAIDPMVSDSSEIRTTFRQKQITSLPHR